MADKSRFGPELSEAQIDASLEEFDSGVSNKSVILLGFAGYKMMITNSALRAWVGYLSLHIQCALI